MALSGFKPSRDTLFAVSYTHLKQLSISQWIPMGHSYGGQLALLYALQYPQRTAKLIYICPSFNLYISMKFVFEKSITLLSQKGQFQKALLLKQTMTRCTTAQDYVEQLAEIPREIREEVYYSKDWKAEIKASIASVKATEEQWRNGQKQQALLFQEGCLFEDYMLYLPKITVPSLLLVGEYDPICPPIQQKAFLQHAPAGMLATIPQAGHDAYNDNPEQFIKAVTQFI